MIPMLVHLVLAALDLQSCGVTTEGAKSFVEVLKLNPCLMVLDVRANELIGEFVLSACMNKPFSCFVTSR